MNRIKKITVTTLMAFGFYVNQASAIDLKVEPQNWWVGMKHQKVELLLKGDNIQGTTWQLVPYADVSLSSVSFGDSPNYAFVTLNIGEDAKPGVLTLKNQDLNLSFNYELQARVDGSRERVGFSSEDVIYLLNPDRFANGDLSNDSVPAMIEKAQPNFRGGRHGGDIQGVIDHLDYLADMGFSQIWMTPVRENNMPSYSYHGYAMTDFYRIDPRMGNNALYKTLVDEAKSRNIGIIMDMVLNHSGSEHWWIKDKPTLDWINFGGEFSSTTHARQTVQDPHASEYDKKQFVEGWFVPSMPDLNQRQRHMSNYLIQNAIWWIEYAGLSGIRVDTYSYSDKAFLSEWTERIMEEYPNFNIVGEEWTPNSAIASYWQRGKQNRDGYMSSLPSVMDFSLQEALIQALNEEESWNTGWIKVYQSIANDFQYPDPDNLLIFADNHDMSRVYSQLKQDLNKTKLAMSLLLTTRGIPQIYYGTEVLLDNTPSDDHGDIRIDFPGGFPEHKQDAKTGLGLNKSQQEMQAHLRQLLQLRKANPVLHKGKLVHFSPFDGIYAYARIQEEQQVLVLLNKSKQKQSVVLSRFGEFLKSVSQGKDLLTGQMIRLQDTIDVAPMSTTLLLLQH
ncbi:glycoside hydrolase family 13 protein [Pseudoalteromonas maricaloris]|uniref:glycoside hydrolase family 13 protein n=1 Tax=Pseudoalteromonas maricaloris TaxID=184924 RepID=UPI003C1620BC